MLGIAIGMFLGLAAFFSYLQPQTRRRIVGYGLALDISVWIVFLTFFGGTGMERMSAIFASMGVTAFIHLYRKLFGYERRVSGKWMLFPGVFTPRT